MASNLKIRPLRAADEAAWQQLFSDYATFYKAKIPADAVEAAFHGMLSADLTLRGWVAVINDKPVGLAHLVLHPSTWSLLPDAYLNDLFVDPTYRRLGVGRALLQEVVNRVMRRAGANCIGKPQAITRRLKVCIARSRRKPIGCL